jgi:hypothetical protein
MTAPSYERELQRLLDASGKVLEAAYVDEAAARDAIEALKRVQQRIEQRLSALARHVEGVIDQSAQRTATEAARLLTENFVTADQAADAAAKRYRQAERSIGLTIAGAGLFTAMLVLISVWIFAWRTVPSQSDIDGRRALIAQLDDQIAQKAQEVEDLERRRGELQARRPNAQKR